MIAPLTAVQLAAAVAELDSQIAAQLLARRRLLELARLMSGQAPAPPWCGTADLATARQIRHDLIQ